ncbi:RELN-like protein [Mya arenaria]|uniref:Reelin n=1 Tax=Mya arenaria TaxID=6604 RepID=A0ABY7FV42_MYAAR|nr:RELN-like protein [Mya arenaria]
MYIYLSASKIRKQYRFTSLKGATRFRWQQRPVNDDEAITNFGLTDVYIGPSCQDMCGGHGNCHPQTFPSCICDPGHHGDNCYPWDAENKVGISRAYFQSSK